MSDKSPLFVSALELLAHATELYASGKPPKHKFVVLHLANAIELIVKDRLIDLGASIYKNPRETLTIWGCFEELERRGVVLREKPIIELLVDDRNTIQHRFGFPNAVSVFYYLEHVVAFFQRFLRDYYDVDLAEALTQHLSKDELALLNLEHDEGLHLKKLFAISPEASMQHAYLLLEVRIRDALVKESTTGNARFATGKQLIEMAVANGIVDTETEMVLEQLRTIRNGVAHGASIITKGDIERMLPKAIQILEGLRKRVSGN
jgi:uncharacterized protein YutE (UPF0331/DUF86 family)